MLVVAALCKFAVAGERALIPILLDALDDAHGNVRDLAAGALAKLDLQPKEVLGILTATPHHRGHQARLLAIGVLANGRVTSDIVALLAPALRDEDARIRERAVTAIGKATPGLRQLAAPDLMQTLNDDDEAVQRAAVAALERLGPPTGVEALNLAALLTNRTTEVRRYAAHALCQLGTDAKTAVNAVADATDSSDERVRLLAIQTLGKIGPAAQVGRLKAHTNRFGLGSRCSPRGA